MNKLFYLFTVLLLAACSSDETTFVPRITMEEYIANNNITTQTHSSGLQYVINTMGDGNHPHASSTVTVKYVGKFTDDEVFDSSNNDTFTRSLNDLIDGWKIGVPLLSKGGSGTFYIPYEIAYGETGNSNIPPRSDLIFEIELVNF